MLKAQSSIEYLTTYAWALIVIAVALAALYTIGVFNTGGLTASASPGGCQVYRPYGGGSVQVISLQGLCSGIRPKFVARFSGTGNVEVPDSYYLNATSQITITAWIYASGGGPSTQEVLSKASAMSSNGYIFPKMENGGSEIAFSLGIGNSWDTLTANYPNPDSWHFVAAAYNGYAMSIYIDGSIAAETASYSGDINTDNNILVIGGDPGTYFTGLVSNVQVYNKSLNSNQISQLYGKGIGEPPQLLQNIVGWWPLNGDAGDYSGNGDNGASNSIAFVSSWNNGYSH